MLHFGHHDRAGPGRMRGTPRLIAAAAMPIIHPVIFLCIVMLLASARRPVWRVYPPLPLTLIILINPCGKLELENQEWFPTGAAGITVLIARSLARGGCVTGEIAVTSTRHSGIAQINNMSGLRAARPSMRQCDGEASPSFRIKPSKCVQGDSFPHGQPSQVQKEGTKGCGQQPARQGSCGTSFRLRLAGEIFHDSRRYPHFDADHFPAADRRRLT